MNRRFSLLLAPAVVALGLVFAAGAHAAADIEGVWSFSGGEVAVQAQPDGTFKGTVIRPTRFSDCTHPTGEEMWIEVRSQPDGQYFGRHQWFNTADCTYIGRGNTAFRVLRRADGSSFLRVCFAAPENPELQPTIAPDGTSANTTSGCGDSDLLRPLPAGTPRIDRIANLPKGSGKKGCRSRRSFTIRLKEPPGDALVSAVVYLNGKQIKARKGKRLTVPINLKGLPKGTYTVKIVAKTVLGKTITGKRRYRTCQKGHHGSGNKV
jgi:uncharacterized protein (DUF2147 family)